MRQERIPSLENADSVRLHTNLAEVYRDKVAELEKSLDHPTCRSEASEILRSLIDEIVLTPTAKGLKAELRGDLAAILELCHQKERRPDARLSGILCK